MGITERAYGTRYWVAWNLDALSTMYSKLRKKRGTDETEKLTGSVTVGIGLGANELGG